MPESGFGQLIYKYFSAISFVSKCLFATLYTFKEFISEALVCERGVL